MTDLQRHEPRFLKRVEANAQWISPGMHMAFGAMLVLAGLVPELRVLLVLMAYFLGVAHYAVLRLKIAKQIKERKTK